MGIVRNTGYLFYFDGRVEYFEHLKTENALHYAEWVTSIMSKGELEMLIEMPAIVDSIDEVFNLCVCVGNREEPSWYTWQTINHGPENGMTTCKEPLRSTPHWDTFLENRDKALALEFLRSS